jgi:hypothetical protein
MQPPLLPIQVSMSTDAATHLELLLEQLDEEERAISAERRRLQDRIDYFAGVAGASDELAELERKERDLSRRRRELHARIDALRGE